MGNRATYNTVTRYIATLILGILLVVPTTLTADGVPVEKQVTELLAKLRVSTAAGPGRPLEEEHLMAKQLARLGEAVVPLMMKELGEEITETNDFYQRRLVGILADIPGQVTTRALLDLALYHRKEHAFFNVLVRGPLTMRKIECPISDDEVSMLLADSKNRRPAELESALDTAQILSQCVRLPIDTRLMPAKELLLDALGVCSTDPNPLVELPAQVRAVVVKGVMLAASNTGLDGRELWRRMTKNSTNEQERLWLTAALGMTGDRDAAAALHDAINTEQDIHLRAILVMAYARAAKGEAIPFLEELTEDTTVTGYQHGYAVSPVADAARVELMKLGVQSKPKMPAHLEE